MFGSVGITELLVMVLGFVIAVGVPAAIIVGLVMMLRKRDEKLLAQRAAEEQMHNPQALPPHQESTWMPGMCNPTATPHPAPQPRQQPTAGDDPRTSGNTGAAE